MAERVATGQGSPERRFFASPVRLWVFLFCVLVAVCSFLLLWLFRFVPFAIPPALLCLLKSLLLALFAPSAVASTGAL